MATVAHSEPLPSSALPARKIHAVQGLRAIAVLLVVWTHSIVAASYHSVPRQARFFHLKSFGACGLDLFFVISGVIVSLVASRAASERRDAAARFLLRRCTRIFPLYWILTLVVILEAEFGRYRIQWHRVPWLPTLLLLPGGHYPVPPLILSLGWSLLFEIYFYLVLSAWMKFTPRDPVRNASLFLIGMVGLGTILGVRRPLLVVWANPLALEFVFGCLIGQLYQKLRGGPDPTTGGARAEEPSPASRPLFGLCLEQTRVGPGVAGRWIAAVGAVALLATLFTGYGAAGDASSILAGLSGWTRVGLWGVPSALLVLGTVLWNPALRSLPGRLLVFLGDASYSIYLCTNPARSAIEHFWRYAGRWGGDVGVLLCGCACVATGLVCYLVLERPLMRRLHNWYKQIPFGSGAESGRGPGD